MFFVTSPVVTTDQPFTELSHACYVATYTREIKLTSSTFELF